MASHGATMVGIGFAMALAVSLSGCAGKVRLSSKTSCEAHGGTYSSQTKQCTYPAQQPARSASQVCKAQGGTYDEVSDSCVFDESSR